ncbi:hypothetical protein Pla123a_05640 [Posidoniimonas polymericola]|uniref:S-adenosylmethionine tRNA ribosyltransferase n=1 Tax=Posidoniimonas polymericola TaxID=2528002 RepID=A0A5C5ZFF3_9BACT|nr:DUF3253 domain-containing protein [Posidoniimonas polymericola]TWT85757.1 hypothetical protein Pla123a_05640 [Posidoniimonas polymericola]
MAETTAEQIAACLLELAEQRGAGKTFCPSEAARRLSPEDWRPLMPAIRSVATRLAEKGGLAITQAGRPASIDAKGPIRLGLPDC